MKKDTAIRHYLMTKEGYTPYCINPKCRTKTKWSKKNKQFVCKCGWVSKFSPEFIGRYIIKWELYY